MVEYVNCQNNCEKLVYVIGLLKINKIPFQSFLLEKYLKTHYSN